MRTLILFTLSTASLCLTACTGQVLQKDDPGNPGSHPNTVHLERHFQRVVHYDCNKRVTSDSIETVKSPTQRVTVYPANTANLGGSDFHNRRNGASAAAIFDYTTFKVDYSYGFFNMHVEPGINTVDYTFYACDSWQYDPNNGSKYCASAKTVQEKGTVTLDVSYEEKHLDGTFEIDDCAPKPSPTP